LPDDRWGELVCAAIVVRSGAATPTLEELRAHLASRLASHKHPRVIVPVDELPHTDATGQIRRAALRDRLISREH
jgi:acyl-CoA synthetase (AMP-forming)/AMP-acid ligase II